MKKFVKITGIIVGSIVGIFILSVLVTMIKSPSKQAIKQSPVAQASSSPSNPGTPLSDDAYSGLLKLSVLTPLQEMGNSLSIEANDIQNLNFDSGNDDALFESQAIKSELSDATFGLNELKGSVPADKIQSYNLLMEAVNNFVKADNLLIPAVQNKNLSEIQVATKQFQSAQQLLSQYLHSS